MKIKIPLVRVSDTCFFDLSKVIFIQYHSPKSTIIVTAYGERVLFYPIEHILKCIDSHFFTGLSEVEIKE